MRIGTWNLDNNWSDAHADLLLKQECDVWLLTEVHPKSEYPRGRIAGFHCHLSRGTMTCKQHWAGILSRLPLTPLPDPHEASAAAEIEGITFCSSVLPWRGCAQYWPTPGIGTGHAEMAKATIEALTKILPKSALVWGGDWNQNLTGDSESVGSSAGQSYLKAAIEMLGLLVPTSALPHRLGGHSIDHIAVPNGWSVKKEAQLVEAGMLSSHDAYIVDVLEKPR